MSTQENDTTSLEGKLQGKMSVWHFDSNLMPARLTNPQWPQEYALVAALDTESLDEAFYWTNEGDGWMCDSVTVFPPFGWQMDLPESVFHSPRSTSVGDVLVKPNGDVFVVEAAGFRRIGHST